MNIAIEWLKASNDDLRTIEKIISEEYLTHIVAFHSQQSIEKSLKAYLEFKNEKVFIEGDGVRTHQATARNIKEFQRVKDLQIENWY